MVLLGTGAVLSASLPAAMVQAAGAPPGGKLAYNPPVYRGKLWSPRKLPASVSVGGHPLSARAGRRARARFNGLREPVGIKPVAYRGPGRIWWPSGAGTAALTQAVTVTHGPITGQVARELAGPQRAGALPVTVTAVRGSVSAATVRVVPRRTVRAAGISGLMLTLSARPGGSAPASESASGRVLVRLDYARFAENYGGSWASRLKLVELPACALTTPSAAGCREESALSGSNDGKGLVWASVPVGDGPARAVPPQAGGTRPSFSAEVLSRRPGAVILAAVSTPGGSAGNYAATSLTPEGKWDVQQGNFDYDYPVAAPESLGGPAPNIDLSYSSASIDGETSAQNPQGSQVGDGWDDSPGYIEQSYEPCSQDSTATQAEQGDDCWDGYNATLSLDGHSGLLIGSGPGTWHLRNDDGTSIQLETGGANSMWNGEYWVVTTTDGTKYYFGANHVPGSSSSTLTTSSAWNVPVYCPATTDACYSSSTGTSSVAQMPYRWNLDYVVDPDNNLTVYQYGTETNYYMRGGSTGGGTLTSYIRDGYLKTVLYGWHLADATASPAVFAADKIAFNASSRCLSNCGTVTSTAYPDVPTDQICSSTDTSCNNASATFFSEKRLTSIDTYVLKSQSSDTYDEVDNYALAQSFLTGTGETTAVMGLNSITRTGEDGTSTLLPMTTFTLTMMNNRVLGTSQPALYRPRITKITTQSGEGISVTYNPPECTQGSGGNITDADAPTNTMTCYPAYWAPPGDSNSMDWFNYYTVSQIQESDLTGAHSPAQTTSYTYPATGVAWHYDESPAESSKYRTWDEYRGYLQVETTTGIAPDPVTETMTWYLRGMNGDNNGSGGTTSVSVIDGLKDSYVDYDYLNGQALEVDTYNAAGGSPDHEQVYGPWTFNQTASMTPPAGSGLSALTANMLAQAQDRTRRLLANGNWQTSTDTTYDNGAGQVVAADDAPAGLTETCTSTSYAPAPSGNSMMKSYPDQVTVVSGGYTGGSCPAATSGDIVSDTQTYYDDESATISALGTFGTLASPGGLATGVARAVTWPQNGSESWQNMSATEYDGYGRALYSADPNGNVTKTTYSPATEQLATSVSVKNPKNWTTTTALDQGTQQPLSITDENSEVTSYTYDGLGRVTSVTLPIDQGGDASYKYVYNITGTAPSTVTTQVLLEDGGYSSDIKIFDGLMQLIQDQTTTADDVAGRLVEDYGYNTDGWEVSTTTTPFYDDTSGPGTTLFVPNADEVPSLTVTSYDGQGRTTASALYSLGVYQWQTSTSYPGLDQSDVTPPSGGTTNATVTDSLGRTSQSLSYYDSSGDAVTTSYAYTTAGQIASIADNNSNAWSYTYNLLGQKTSETDPGTSGTAGPAKDQGTTTYTYGKAGNLQSTTDPSKTVLTYSYDSLGRKTAEYNATPGLPGEPVELASWAYDQTPLNGSGDTLGQPSSSTSYDASGQAYTESYTGYNTSYEPTGTSLSVPADAGALESGSSGTGYTTSTAYTPRTGLPEYTSYSADGGLPAETVYNTYDITGLLTQFGDVNDYLDNVSYSPTGRALSTTFGAYGTQLVQDSTYDAGTARMLQSITNLQTLSSAADTTSYTYDEAGNITSASDQQNTGGTQTQCYSYNALDELTAAWTDTGGTTTAGGTSVAGIGGCTNSSPAATNIGGPAPYWETYTYDLLGDRTSETTYNTSLSPSQDTLANATVQQVEYPGGNLSNSPSSNSPDTAQAQPDSAASVVTTSPGGTTTTSPGYDADGQLTSQTTKSSTGSSPPPGPPGLSGVTYNPQGEVASATTSAGNTASYFYDADGNLLLQTGSNGPTTLYVDGGAEQIMLNGSTLSGLRFFTASPDGTSIVESSSGTDYYQVANQQGTALESITTSTLAITRRYYDPWGDPAGSNPVSWPDSSAFLGKPEDQTTGLVILGVRQYDPAMGAFLSLDPVFEGGDSTQMGGYAYAADNPATNADPNGELYITGGSCVGSLQYCEKSNGGVTSTSPYYGAPYYSPTYNESGSDPCGYSTMCGATWPVPPKPRTITQDANVYQCAHGFPNECAPHQVPVYQNGNQDWSLGAEFFTGLGKRSEYFDQWDPMTQSLMRDANTAATIAQVRRMLANPMWMDSFNNGYALTGSNPYMDKSTPEDFVLDGLGATTHGSFGHNWADSFTGSYDQTYTAVARGTNTATVYFTVTNQTNLNSLLHPEITWRFIPIIGAIPVRSISSPWDVGPFSETTQTFQWQQVIHY